MSKKEYKKMIDLALQVKDKDNVLKQAEGKEKCKRVKEECYGKKKYMSENKISEVRELFKTRFGLQPFAGNFSHDRRFSSSEWKCKCGEAKEQEDHLRSGECEIYGDIRRKHGNLDDDISLLAFFREVLARREELEEEETRAAAAAATRQSPGRGTSQPGVERPAG